MFEEIRAQFFPMPLGDGFIAETLERETFNRIVFGEGGLMLRVFVPQESESTFPYPEGRDERMKPLREIFAQTHRERVLFFSPAREPVGWSWGDMLDGMTYFMTSTGILPDYRRRGLYTAFLKGYLSYLYALGYERVTSKHQLNNRAVVIAKLRAGFNILGVDADERWGAQVQLAYFFHDDRRLGFERAFSLYPSDKPVYHL
jgi:GNAT superfamily N-acetyltransferase